MVCDNYKIKKTLLFLDYFEEGLRHQIENGLNLAEQSLSQALKILSASTNDSHFNKEKATCFHTMAEIYSTRALQQEDNNVFCEMMVKSIALFEAERIYKYGSYKEDKEINTAILEAEVKFIDKIFGHGGVERFKRISKKRVFNRTKLDEIRSRVINEYFPTLAKFPDWSSEDEEKRCHEIESIYKQIHDDMKCFMVDIFLYCNQIAGPAPCNFSIIGLGSMSRQEVTPYSDLEFSILIEDENSKYPSQEQRQYFRFLTHFIQVQIIKLGETILPSIGISSLNNFYSKNKEDDWFYDDIIPKGFSFDGMMPWACKTPLGRKEWRGKPRQEYIMTVDEMLRLQHVTPGCSMESLKTANVFSSVCHLFGDERLTKTYEQKLSALLSCGDRKKSFQQQVVRIMQSLLETYGVKGISLQDFGTQQDVKKEVYRLTSLLVEQLSKFFGIFGQCSWQCIQEMCKKKILTEGGAKNLLAALSITTELRLKCYQNHGRQKEALPVIPQLSVTETKSTPCSFTTAIVRLYQSLMPLKSVVSGIIEVIENDVIGPEALVFAVFQTVDFIDVSPFMTAKAYLRVLQLPKAFDCLLSAKDNPMNITDKVEVLLMLSSCYNMVGKFQEAIECCREVQTLHTLAPDVVPLLPALELIMTVYVRQGLYSEALKMYKEIMDYQERPDMKENFVEKELDFLNRSAVLFMNIEQYNTAEDILRTIIEKIRNQRRYYFVYFSCLNNLAFILLNKEKPAEAKTVLNDALNIASDLYGENAIHPSFAWCLTNLSGAHYHLENIEEANRLLQLALIIYSHLHKHELIEPGIIVALIMEARIHQFYERWDQMLNSLNKAKQIAEIVYRGNPHPNVASILFYLGYCEQQLGRFSEAINRYQEYLKIHENHRMECQQSRHDCNTASALIQIATMGACCSYDASYLLSCLEKALEIEENIHGKGCNHYHSAMCFGLLGYRLITADRESKGLEYLCRAMQMFEEINLDSDKIYGQAQLLQLLFENILGENCINKSEKHLRTVEAILKKHLKDNCHVALLEINSFLLKIFLQTNKIQDGLELAEQQRRLIHTMLYKSSVPSAQQLYQVFHLAAFFEDSGRRNTAKEMYFDLITRLEEQVDPTDSGKDAFTRLLWMTQQKVGEIYRTNEMFCDAEAMFQRIASSVQKTTSKRAFVKDTRHVTQNSLALVFTETGRYLQAYKLLDDLINIYEKDSKSIDVGTASCAFSIRGELNRRCFRFNFALEDLEKASKLAEQYYGASAIHNVTLTKARKLAYAENTNTIGLIYEQNNNLKRALEYYFCCLNTVEGIPVTMGTATFHQNVADTLKKLGKLDAALVHYKKSLEIRETLHSEDPEREDIATVLYHIALVQYTDGKPKDASATLDRLIPLRKELLCKGGSLQGGCLQNYGAAIFMKGNCHIVQPGEAKQAKDAYEEAEKVVEILTEGQPNLDYAGVLSNIGEHNVYMYRKRL